MLLKLSVHALAYPNSEILHFVTQDYTCSKNRDGTDLTLSYTGFSGWFYTGSGGGHKREFMGKLSKRLLVSGCLGNGLIGTGLINRYLSSSINFMKGHRIFEISAGTLCPPPPPRPVKDSVNCCNLRYMYY